MLPTLPEAFIPLSERPHLEAAIEKASRQGHPVANFLKGELERASFCSRADMPPDTVTMNGWVNFRVDWGPSTPGRRLVYPEDYNGDEDQLPLLTPLGAALLGLRAGDRMPFLSLENSYQLVTVEDTNPPVRVLPFQKRAHSRPVVTDTTDPFDPGPQAA
jgi:regulator of nucleoside diphosphate kinase